MAERRNDDRCGICDHPREGHGIRYAAVVGEHHWVWDLPWLRADNDDAAAALVEAYAES